MAAKRLASALCNSDKRALYKPMFASERRKKSKDHPLVLKKETCQHKTIL